MRKLFFIVSLAALILLGCNGTSTAAPARSTVTPHPSRPTPNATELEITDPAKPMEVAAGDDFTITVKTNLASEYHWEIAEALDPKVVEYVWKDHKPDDPGNPDSSGKDIWRFQAVAPGQTTITLGYYQGMTIHAAQKPVFTIVVK